MLSGQWLSDCQLGHPLMGFVAIRSDGVVSLALTICLFASDISGFWL